MTNLSLKKKIILTSMTLTVLMGSAAAVVVRENLRKTLQAAQLGKTTFIANRLSFEAENYVLTEQNSNLGVILHDFADALNDVENAYILGPEGTVLAHTFEEGFPSDLKKVNQLEEDAEYSFATLSMGDREFVDIAVPIAKGELGSAHIIITHEHINEASNSAALLVLQMIGAGLVLSSFASIFIARRITKPLVSLVDTSQKVIAGDLNARTQNIGSDEVGQLGAAFNKMLDKLQKTMVSREEFQKQSTFMNNVLEAIPFPFYIVDADDYSLADANKAARNIGAKIGMTCHGATHKSLSPCSDKNHKCPLAEIKKTGNSAILEHVHQDADGFERQYEVHGYPIFDANGALKQMIEFSIDITDRKEVENQLRLFKTILDQSKDAVFVIDPESGKFIDVNKGACSSLGYDCQEFLNLSVMDIDLHIFDKQLWEDHSRDLAEMKSMVFESKHKRKDSSIFPVEVSVVLASHESSQYALAVARDISDRKAAETCLLKNQAELSQKHEVLNALFKKVERGKEEWEKTMDCIDDMVILLDADNRIKRCNRSFTDFLGLDYQDVIDKPLEDSLAWLQTVEGDKAGASAELFHHATGRFFIFERFRFTGKNVDQNLAFVATLHDFTARKLAAEELKKKSSEIEVQNQKLQNILNELSVIIEKVGEEQNLSLRYINAGVEKCYELTQCEADDCPCYGQEAMRCWHVVGTLKCGDSTRDDYPIKLRNCIECQVFKKAAEDPIQQIGEQFNNMMQMLEFKNDELKKAYRDLEHTHAQMVQSEKMASIGQLAAGVAHEINNPIGFISSNLDSLGQYVATLKAFLNRQSELVKTGCNPEMEAQLEQAKASMDIDFILSDVVELVGESLEGAKRVAEIVQNLKTFSHIDGNDYEELNLKDCMESTLKIVWNTLKYKITVHKDYGEIPATMGYPRQINQVFVNLLINAAQAIKERGEIIIKTWSENGSACASVSDTGCGMPKEILGRIFDPFYTTKEVGKGTGLGLSISYDIVKKHHGTIEVESELEKGTTFTVKIPVIKPGSELKASSDIPS